MLVQISSLSKTLAAVTAGEGLAADVDADVVLHVAEVGERLSAVVNLASKLGAMQVRLLV